MDNQFNHILKKFVIPSCLIGIGGSSKLPFAYTDALYYEEFGFRPDVVRFTIFDFDEAPAKVTLNGNTFSTEPYTVNLPKKIARDVVKKIKKGGNDGKAFREKLKGYLDFDSLRWFDTPGLNLCPSLARLAWSLVWESHVLKDLQSKIFHLHVTPRDRDKLAEQGIRPSNRSLIFIIAGLAGTTGPSGIAPMLCEISRLKPPEANVIVILITPKAYRDKSSLQREKGRAICMATVEVLSKIAIERDFDQPFGTDGYRIVQADKPWDLCLLSDGTFSGGKSILESDELARLIALFIFWTTTSPLGEELLRVAGNLHTKEERNDQS
jgi:hypothetical protein